MARAVEGRRAEFAHGRAAARDALEGAGGPRVPILVGAGREPLWPEGWVGSITHCPGMTAAVAASVEVVAALGIDAEILAPLPAEALPLVLHPGERDEAEAMGLPLVALFSAKEAVHKALFPATRVWMDFLDVRVRPDRLGGFRAEPAPGGGPTAAGLDRLRGRVAAAGAFVVSLVWLPRLDA